MLVRSIRYAFERKRSEEALRRSESTVRAIFENSLDGIVIVGEDGVFIEANLAAATLFGVNRQELIGDSIHNFTTLDFKQQWQRFQAAGIGRGEFWLHRRDGSKRLADCGFSANILPGRDLYMMRDITEQQDLEEQLRQSQKMEAVGRLAGGVAHDFNNVLTAIFGYADLVLDSFDAADPRKKDVEEIKRAANRAAGLTRQLLAFSRKQVMQPRRVNLNEIIENLETLLLKLIGQEVVLLIDLGPSLWAVKADPGQIEQVLMNLASNAKDAMPDGGRLTISTANDDLEPHEAAALTGIEPGRFVRLNVSDSGHGIPDHVRTHIFEPFFTTKEQGKGTGLGLATVYGIVKQSGGWIYLDETPRTGASFRIYLPRVE